MPGRPTTIISVATTEPQSTSSIGRIQARIMTTQATDASKDSPNQVAGLGIQPDAGGSSAMAVARKQRCVSPV
ncbi:hypothetical protein GCM10010388_65730 [Streptomyces mauvecolor]